MEVTDKFYPRGKSPRYPLKRKLGGPRADLCAGAKRNISCPYRESISGSPARCLVTILLKWTHNTIRGSSADLMSIKVVVTHYCQCLVGLNDDVPRLQYSGWPDYETDRSEDCIGFGVNLEWPRRHFSINEHMPADR
jgi:hypothetical protein